MGRMGFGGSGSTTLLRGLLMTFLPIMSPKGSLERKYLALYSTDMQEFETSLGSKMFRRLLNRCQPGATSNVCRGGMDMSMGYDQ